MGRIGFVAAIGLLVGACGSNRLCPAGCVLASSAAAIAVACPANVVTASVSGPCQQLQCAGGTEMLWPECLTAYGAATAHMPANADLTATATGTCHVEMRFADGYLYATDIQFVGRPLNDSPGCPSCPPVTTPVSAPPPVDDPAGACPQDAGADAKLAEAGHRYDAEADQQAGDADGD
jgi:hypothetical protein